MQKSSCKSTIEESVSSLDARGEIAPGLVLVMTEGAPRSLPIRLGSRPIEIGRQRADRSVVLEDDRVSRRHTAVVLDGTGVRVTDLGSRNGTFVDGARITDHRYTELPRVLRVGHSLFLFRADLGPFYEGGVVPTDGQIIGPTLRASREQIARASAAGTTLLITGPSGAGKELAARAFHGAGGDPARPFLAINCATIPEGVAERLLFGARKGAFSGAVADVDGYVQAADGGTLFLDEIGELDLSVQAKLLRVIESREVLAVGASVPRKVDVRICAATLRDLRADVASGRFREDLYYRIGRPEVRVPGLAERPEEIPWLARAEIERVDPALAVSALLVEACLLRLWPGNVRELSVELRQAASAAQAASRQVVEAKDLADGAGMDMLASSGAVSRSTPDVVRDQIEAALRQERGNVTRAARVLGLHRNQLRRRIAREGIDPHAFGAEGDSEVGETSVVDDE